MTLVGGDLDIVETSDYSLMPDGNSADIRLRDRVGAFMDLYQYNGHGHIDMAGVSNADLSFGSGGNNYMTIYNASPNTGIDR